MDADPFEDFVFSNISNNQSFGEHGGHLRGGGASKLEDHFQTKLWNRKIN